MRGSWGEDSTRLILDLLGIIFAVYICVVYAAPALIDEFTDLREIPVSVGEGVIPKLEAATGEVTHMPGTQVLGMLQFVESGEFDLVIDGVRISQNTDLELVDFRGVVGFTYQVVQEIIAGEVVVYATNLGV